MSKIHFDNIGGNWKALAFIILALACLLVGGLGVLDFSNPKTNELLVLLAFLVLVVYSSKMFWYKNYVQWNKKGIVIRIKSFLGKALKFDEIRTSELNGSNLMITKIDGTTLQFNLTGIAEADTQKLNGIIVNNTIANVH